MEIKTTLAPIVARRRIVKKLLSQPLMAQFTAYLCHLVFIRYFTGLLPDTLIVGCACPGNAVNVFPAIDFKEKTRVSDPDMHHVTCVTHMPWFMSGLLTRGDWENVPGIPGACTTHNFTYLVRCPCGSRQNGRHFTDAHWFSCKNNTVVWWMCH